jgi:hypothetical protein
MREWLPSYRKKKVLISSVFCAALEKGMEESQLSVPFDFRRTHNSQWRKNRHLRTTWKNCSRLSAVGMVQTLMWAKSYEEFWVRFENTKFALTQTMPPSLLNCLCIEGLARRVCPSYNVLDAAKPLLQSYQGLCYNKNGGSSSDESVEGKPCLSLLPSVHCSQLIPRSYKGDLFAGQCH